MIAQIETSSRPRPSSRDAERSVLSSLLEVPRLFNDLPDLTDALYEPDHKIVYRVLREHHDAGKPVDLVSLAETLRAKNLIADMGGPGALADMAAFNPAPGVALHHARLVLDNALRRKVITLANNAVSQAYNEDLPVADLLENLQQQALALHSNDAGTVGKDLRDCVREAIDRAEEMAAADGLIGVPTGLPLLDQHTGGYRPGLNVICARPSMGKSAFALQGALAAVAAGRKVGFFSFEMEGAEVGERTVQHVRGVSLLDLANRIKVNQATKAEAKAAKEAMEMIPAGSFFVDDHARRTLSDIRTIAKSWVRDRGIDIIYIDQLSFVDMGKRPGDNLAAELGKITRGLHQLSHALHIPIVLLAQLNREAEGREPDMSMLKGSGSIEEDARLILSPWREDPSDPDEINAKIIALKTRGVAMFNPVLCEWHGAKQKFIQTDSQLKRADLDW